jgi:hypothetical protein
VKIEIFILFSLSFHFHAFFTFDFHFHFSDFFDFNLRFAKVKVSFGSLIANKMSSVFKINSNVNQIINIMAIHLNFNHAIITANVIKTIARVYALVMVCVNAGLIMYRILKPNFVIILLKNIVIIYLIVVIINSVLIICVNVNQAIDTILLMIFVIKNFVNSTAIVIYLIRIVSVN